MDLDKISLNIYVPKVIESPYIESPYIESTDTWLIDELLFSDFLRSPSPLYISSSKFSSSSNDTAVNIVFNEPFTSLNAKPYTLDYNFD